MDFFESKKSIDLIKKRSTQIFTNFVLQVKKSTLDLIDVFILLSPQIDVNFLISTRFLLLTYY